ASDSSSMEYAEDGTVKVKIPAVSQDGAVENLADFMTGVRDVRNADMQAAAESIYNFLDNISDANDLMRCLEDFEKTGNGQIILDYNILKSILTDDQAAKFFAAAHSNGVKIIAAAKDGAMTESEAKSKAQELYKAGFDGYFYKETKEKRTNDAVSIYDFALASKVDAGFVEEFTNSQSLIEKMRETRGAKILINSEVVKAINNDRSMPDKTNFIAVLKGVVLLGALNKDVNTEEFVRGAAYGLKYDLIPEMKGLSDKEIALALQAKSAADIVKMMDISETHPIALRLSMISSGVKDAQKAETLQKAYLESIAERTLVSRAVAGAIVNKTLEKALGKTLMINALTGNTAESEITADAFKEQIKQTLTGVKKKDYDAAYTTALQNGLIAKVNSLAEAAFTNKDAAALATIAELIPAIADVRFNFKMDKKTNGGFDKKMIESLLSAA
ncbi:MAG: hypothetical protein FWC57_04145, partial [Endomicrobia bacterium]|nr:hypothetical protein [Endomicrobiia bacterium]